MPECIPHEKLALSLLDWHGGQHTALYSVGSCLLAQDERWSLRIIDATLELRKIDDPET